MVKLTQIWLVLRVVALFAAILPGIVFAADTSLPPILTTVDQVRRLPSEEAGKAYPVRVRGVITYRAEGRSLMFLQDSTGGIYVHPDKFPENIRKLKAGTEVEIEGNTVAGRFAPFVEGRNGRVIGAHPLPEARWLTADQLSDPRNHSQWVEAGGFVRSVTTQLKGLDPEKEAVITIGSRAGRFTVAIYGPEAANPTLTNLTGALVRVRGVFGSIFNERRQLVGFRLFVSSTRNIFVDRAGGGDPFDATIRPIASLMQFQPGPETPAQAHVRGRVTLVTKDEFYIEDDSAGVKVQPTKSGGVHTGETVEVAGFPVLGECSPILEDAETRPVETMVIQMAPVVTVERAMSGDYAFREVRIEASVIDVVRHQPQPGFLLEAGGQVFSARFTDTSDSPPLAIRNGSWVQVTGVCVNQNRPEAQELMSDSAISLVRHPSIFHILLNSPQSVTVLRQPAWWTTSRVLGVLGILVALMMVILLWAELLRRQVTAKTDIIRQQTAREVAHDERERIARELHDTLEQQMTGVAMHLDAAGVMLPKDCGQVATTIETARALLDHSREEARRSIWELRSPVLEQGGLPAALGEIVRRKSSVRCVVEISIEGDPYRLPLKIEAHLLRIADEAITNALKHSDASRVAVLLRFTRDDLQVRVRDNGRGFDPNSINGQLHARFGILGMRERAGKIKGELIIESIPERGTMVAVTVKNQNQT